MGMRLVGRSNRFSQWWFAITVILKTSLAFADQCSKAFKDHVKVVFGAADFQLPEPMTAEAVKNFIVPKEDGNSGIQTWTKVRQKCGLNNINVAWSSLSGEPAKTFAFAKEQAQDLLKLLLELAVSKRSHYSVMRALRVLTEGLFLSIPQAITAPVLLSNIYTKAAKQKGTYKCPTVQDNAFQWNGASIESQLETEAQKEPKGKKTPIPPWHSNFIAVLKFLSHCTDAGVWQEKSVDNNTLGEKDSAVNQVTNESTSDSLDKQTNINGTQDLPTSVHNDDSQLETAVNENNTHSKHQDDMEDNQDQHVQPDGVKGDSVTETGGDTHDASESLNNDEGPDNDPQVSEKNVVNQEGQGSSQQVGPLPLSDAAPSITSEAVKTLSISGTILEYFENLRTVTQTVSSLGVDAVHGATLIQILSAYIDLGKRISDHAIQIAQTEDAVNGLIGNVLSELRITVGSEN